jgi:transcriptional regulator GlxA family with amidase domain
VSSRQLRRRFDRALGYGPAFFARIARVQRFARRAARAPHLGIAEVAAGSGYTDQAHAARDCRAIAGMTPRQLIALLPRTSVAVTLGDAAVVARRAAA